MTPPLHTRRTPGLPMSATPRSSWQIERTPQYPRRETKGSQQQDISSWFSNIFSYVFIYSHICIFFHSSIIQYHRVVLGKPFRPWIWMVRCRNCCRGRSAIVAPIAVVRQNSMWIKQRHKHMTVWWYTYPSEKYEFVSWDDDIPNWMEKIIQMFQTTNQTIDRWYK